MNYNISTRNRDVENQRGRNALGRDAYIGYEWFRDYQGLGHPGVPFGGFVYTWKMRMGRALEDVARSPPRNDGFIRDMLSRDGVDAFNAEANRAPYLRSRADLLRVDTAVLQSRGLTLGARNVGDDIPQDNLDRMRIQNIINLVDQTRPVVRKPMPNHIAEGYKEGMKAKGEPVSCVICLSDEIPDYVLSACGHNYCKGCYQDARLTRCGVCREETF